MMLYVGESNRALADRGAEHLRSARLGYDDPIGNHFHGHDPKDLSICAVWQNAGYSTEREFREIHLAHLLGSFSPSGLNVRSKMDSKFYGK